LVMPPEGMVIVGTGTMLRVLPVLPVGAKPLVALIGAQLGIKPRDGLADNSLRRT